VGRTYADLLDIVIENHVEIDDPAFIPGDKEFIVVVANADRSPGAKIILGQNEYNVVEYQALIHKKLRAWDGVGPLTDDHGNSLIFTVDGLVASGGTVRQSFNDIAIQKGGLHATDFTCVSTGDNVQNDRYKSGALLTQGIDRSIFAGGGNMLDRLIVQNPPDLVSPVTIPDGTEVTLKEDLNGNGSTDAADYEIFGGLRALNTGVGVSDGLFEASIYWHYGPKSCYGDPEYEELLAQRLDQIVFEQEEFDELLAALGIDDLAAAVLAALDCKDIAEADGGCQNWFRTLQALLALEATIFHDGQVVDGTGLDGNHDGPVVMEGGAADGGITVGPNFAAGRRTWVDIIAD
jgi:hypothetical protein